MRKKKYIPHSYESEKQSGEPFAALYRSLLVSDAYATLTKGAKVLYIYCALHVHNAGRIKPGKDFPDIPDMQDERCFYMNLALVSEKYKLYARGNGKSLYRDLDELVTHGLIERVSSGKDQRKKSIYRMSDHWKVWKA